MPWKPERSTGPVGSAPVGPVAGLAPSRSARWVGPGWRSGWVAQVRRRPTTRTPRVSSRARARGPRRHGATSGRLRSWQELLLDAIDLTVRDRHPVGGEAPAYFHPSISTKFPWPSADASPSSVAPDPVSQHASGHQEQLGGRVDGTLRRRVVVDDVNVVRAGTSRRAPRPAGWPPRRCRSTRGRTSTPRCRCRCLEEPEVGALGGLSGAVAPAPGVPRVLDRSHLWEPSVRPVPPPRSVTSAPCCSPPRVGPEFARSSSPSLLANATPAPPTTRNFATTAATIIHVRRVLPLPVGGGTAGCAVPAPSRRAAGGADRRLGWVICDDCFTGHVSNDPTQPPVPPPPPDATAPIPAQPAGPPPTGSGSTRRTWMIVAVVVAVLSSGEPSSRSPSATATGASDLGPDR